MSQSGNIVFYKRNPTSQPVKLLRKLLLMLDPKQLGGASRTKVENDSWSRFIHDQDEVPTEWNLKPSLTNLPSFYRDGRSLSAILLGSPLSERLFYGVEAAIPPEVRGNFRPTDLYVTIGYHDLWENAEHDEGFLFARAFLSIHFEGYGTPNHWLAFREAVFQIPDVLAVKRELESVTGILEQCVYWSV